jgi:hypothetical protein
MPSEHTYIHTLPRQVHFTARAVGPAGWTIEHHLDETSSSVVSNDIRRILHRQHDSAVVIQCVTGI